MRKAVFALLVGLTIAIVLQVDAARSQTDVLKVGVGQTITSVDPHYFNNGGNKMVARHFFDPLVTPDPDLKPKPSLATSWKLIDDLTWEFELRKNVKFSDGTPFTAEDVVASFDRATNLPNSPSSFKVNTASIEKIEIVDPHKIRIKTKYPNPILLGEISEIAIISAKDAKASTEDFNAGRAMNGTGPFKFKEYVPNSRIVGVRNDQYWGNKADWSQVEFQIMTNDAARVAALLSGDVQLIENVPPDLVNRIKTSGFGVFSATSTRLVYLSLDQEDHVPAFVKANEGSKSKLANPLRDVRVRKALTLALDKKALVDRILQGGGTAAEQVQPNGLFGVSTNIRPTVRDIDQAKKLLSEAGYPNGLTMTIHGPSGRLLLDKNVLETLAQMFQRIGIKTTPEAQPWAMFSQRVTKRELSVFMNSWQVSTGEIGKLMTILLATYNEKSGMGIGNRARYDSPEFNDLLLRAMRTMNDSERSKMLSRASEIAMRDVGLIPLYFEATTWAAARGLKYAPRKDQYTLVADLTRTQ